MAESKPKAFVYDAETRDSDAMNARSLAYRTVRDASDMPEDETGKAKHNACALAARNAANAAIKVLTESKPRAEWTDEQTSKAHRFACEVGVKAYRTALAAQGYATPDAIVEAAIKAHEVRMIERKAQHETEFAVAQATGVNDAAKAIFG